MVDEKKKDIVDEVKGIIDEVKEETERTMAKKEIKPSLQPGNMTQPLPEFINRSSFRFIDISFEMFREYVYPNGAKIIIENPMRLSVAKNNAHRLFDMNGLSYYIPPGWISIVWKARPGAPNFIM